MRGGAWLGGLSCGSKGNCSLAGHGVGLTKLWLAVLESSSGKGMYTPRATQLAKMVKRMRISKGLR